MDMTIAALTDGERATLSNILDRGLNSLNVRQRGDHTVELVQRLKRVLSQTAVYETAAAQVLLKLAFAPHGDGLHNVSRALRNHMLCEVLILPSHDLTVWRITWRGWMWLWASGRAQTVLDDRYGVDVRQAATSLPS